MTDVTVVVPTFDEAGNIVRAAAAVRRLGYRLLVVDDASPDGTGAIADSLAAGDDGVAVLHRARKDGLGSAYTAGFVVAAELGSEIVCQMDADLSHDPADLPRLVGAVVDGGADLAIGSRYTPGGATSGWSRHRVALSRAGNWYASRMLRLPVADVTAGFRAWSAAALERVQPETCASAGYGFQVETTWRAVRCGLEVVEVPIVFREREVGASKMSAAIAVEAMVRVTGWGLRERLAPRRGGGGTAG